MCLFIFFLFLFLRSDFNATGPVKRYNAVAIRNITLFGLTLSCDIHVYVHVCNMSNKLPKKKIP